jgi:Domain of unknown function (DUF3786)
MMAAGSPVENLDQALRKARKEFKLLDPAWMASRSGTTYSFPHKSFTVSLFGEAYRIGFPAGSAERQDGSPASARERLIILHYLIQADGTAVKEEWVGYRDLPGARYHEPAFIAEVERPLSEGLAGQLEDLRSWAKRNARILELTGDLAFAWEALPLVPLLIIFNEKDEEFPASARMLFDISAPNYLPTEDLSVLAEIATQRLLENF